jgi:hypothetical protein
MSVEGCPGPVVFSVARSVFVSSYSDFSASYFDWFDCDLSFFIVDLGFVCRDLSFFIGKSDFLRCELGGFRRSRAFLGGDPRGERAQSDDHDPSSRFERADLERNACKIAFH